MRVFTVRIITCNQASTSTRLNSSFDDSSDSGIHEFAYLELMTVGWAKGALVRKKNFSTFEKLYAYLNKLDIGGYISTDDYERAWSCVDNLRLSILRRSSFIDVEELASDSPVPFSDIKTDLEWEAVAGQLGKASPSSCEAVNVWPSHLDSMDTLKGTELWSRVSKARFPESESDSVEGSKDESAACEDAQTEDGEGSEED